MDSRAALVHPEPMPIPVANLSYSCRDCNRARGTAHSVDRRERRLLDPRRSAWSDHFVQEGDAIRPRPGDADAAYTVETYDLNDERKRVMRAGRRDAIERAFRVLEHDRRHRADLERRVADTMRSDRREATEHLRLLGEARSGAILDLLRFRAVPPDADDSCRCRSASGRTLPPTLLEQCPEVDWPEEA